MSRAIHIPHEISTKCFSARLMDIYHLLPLFPGSDSTKNMNAKELNDILLHAVPNVWAKQSYFQGWYFEMKTYKETCAMFEQMENDEQVYEGNHLLKNY